MMILDDFSELTRFVHDEFEKMQQAYGLKQMSEKKLNKISNSVLSAFSIANSTTKKKLKYNSKVDWAIFTAPHCWLWRVFHKKLWVKCLEEMKRREESVNKVNSEDIEETPGEPVDMPVDLSALSLPGTTVDSSQIMLE